jgi:archaetidylinositol phosphate synthase
MTAVVPTPPSAPHVRELTSVLAVVEKRVLIWLAHRLPSWVTSDQLTALGAVAMFGVGAAFAATPIAPLAPTLVPLLLAINWFGDSLDGTLARVRQQQRPRYGFYLDHVVDVANATAMFGGLACSGLMSPMLAAGLLVAYLLLSAESFLATHALGVFRIAFGGFGPTELRIVLSVGALTVLVKPMASPLGLGPWRLFDVGGSVAVAGMAIVFVLSAIRNARALAALEPLPPAPTTLTPRHAGTR